MLRCRPVCIALSLFACNGETTGTGDASTSTTDASTAAPTTTTTGTPTTGDATTSTDGTTPGDTTTTTTTTGDDSTSSGTTSPVDPSTTTTTGGSSGTTTGEPDSTTTTTSTSGESDECVAPTDSDTAADPTPWSRSHGLPEDYIHARDLVVAADGTLTASYQFEGVVDFGGGPIDTDGKLNYVLASYTATGTPTWSTALGGVGPDADFDSFIELYASAVDCAGNIVVAGSFTGTIGTQGETLTAVEGYYALADVIYQTDDMFLIKFNPDGSLRWARRFGDDGRQRFHDVAVQADGTIIVGGASNHTLELGGEPILSGNPFVGVLAAFDPDGQFVWQRHYKSTFDVAVQGLALGPADRISVFGFAGDPTDFGGGPVLLAGSPTFIAQFEPDGAHRWSRRYIDKDHEPYWIGADADGGVVYAGEWRPPNTNKYLSHLARFDAAGQLDWNQALAEQAPESSATIGGLAVGDDISITGNIKGKIEFGGGSLTVQQFQPTLYLARYDLAGTNLAREAHASPHAFSPNGLVYGPDGERDIVGSFGESLDLGDGPMVAVGKQDVFVHRFAP